MKIPETAIPVVTTPIKPAGAGSKPKDSPEKILDVARQFEALMIAEMLKGMQSEDGGGWGGGDDAGSSALVSIGQEQFALALAQRGGIGLAKTVTDSITRHDASAAQRSSSDSARGFANPRS